MFSIFFFFSSLLVFFFLFLFLFNFHVNVTYSVRLLFSMIVILPRLLFIIITHVPCMNHITSFGIRMLSQWIGLSWYFSLSSAFKTYHTLSFFASSNNRFFFLFIRGELHCCCWSKHLLKHNILLILFCRTFCSISHNIFFFASFFAVVALLLNCGCSVMYLTKTRQLQ